MKRVVNALILFLLVPVVAWAGDYEKAWEAIHKNDFKQATTLLQKVIKSGGPQKSNAISTLILVHSITDNESTFLKTYPNPLDVFTDPAPYAYALWFNGAILGGYGSKESMNLENLNRILADSVHYNGSMRAAGYYFKATDFYTSNNNAKAKELYPQMGGLEEWSYVGPFDNIMGSGFDKDYGPVKQPSGGNFISSNNNPVSWFTPLYTTRHGWTYVGSAFPGTNGLGYLQSFVKSPSDMDVILCLGGTGALKVWVNDKLQISEEEERVTELDRWKVKVHLNSGYNRILLQIGFTDDNSRPNFIVRLTDDGYNPIKGLTAVTQVQRYQPDVSKSEPVLIPHFAEEYFKKQVALHPEDPMNAVLLSKVYIRNQEYDLAKAAMNKWYKTYKKDALIQNLYADCLSSKTDRTEIMEIVEALKTLVPDNYWILYNKMIKLEEEKNYTESMEVLDKMIAMKGEQQFTVLKKLQLFAELEKIDSMVQLIKYAYEKYPNSAETARMMYIYESKLNNDPAKALEVLEHYNKENFQLEDVLIEEYLSQGKTEEALSLMRKELNANAYDVTEYNKLIKYFYAKQQYDSALYYIRQEHYVSPYYHIPYGDMANVFIQKQQNDSARYYFNEALKLYAGGFGYREKLRALDKKQPMDKYFPVLDYYKEINQTFKQQRDSSQSYSYVFDEKNVIIYNEGAGEQIINTAVMINNKKGINQWKEISIPYNTVYQDVIIIKAEVIKANGSKIPAETNENEIVFTKLEEGDVVYYNYKINSFGRGRLGREFWDKFYFSAYVPTHISSYNVLIPNNIPLYYECLNSDLKPKISEHEQFKMYSWREENIAAIKDEPFMPSINDIGKVLHLSTVKNWDAISEWYSDITRSQSKESFEINQAYNEIFPKGTDKLSDVNKAKLIYEYIEKNIAYSSVSFRQGAYVPQRASKTLGTKLGDCKDLSTLFLAFARKAGLEANLILVSTKDYGRQNMRLPSMDFNHCIVRYKADGKYNYLELTDNALPFNSLSSGLAGAQILNIPYNYKEGEKISVLTGGNFAPKSLTRSLEIELEGADQKVRSTCLYTGELASEIRHKYQHITKDEMKDAVQREIGGKFKNQVMVDSFSFRNLDNLEDTLRLTVTFTVKNDVINVGDFSMVKPSFIDIVATANIFRPEPRVNPFLYGEYENTDNYQTEITIKLPEGKQFEQVPGNTNLSMGDMKYDLNFRKESDRKLLISRRFTTVSNKEIGAGEFKSFEDFFTGIIKAEQKYVSFR